MPVQERDLDAVEPIKACSMLDAAAAADRPPVERRRRLSQAALAITHRKVCGAYSAIVIAGAVRVADFMLLSVVGIALILTSAPRPGVSHWEYVAAIFMV